MKKSAILKYSGFKITDFYKFAIYSVTTTFKVTLAEEISLKPSM